MQRIVQVTDRGRVYSITVDRRETLGFWRVTTSGYPPYLAPLRVLGDEQAAFFVGLAKVAAVEIGVAENAT